MLEHGLRPHLAGQLRVSFPPASRAPAVKNVKNPTFPLPPVSLVPLALSSIDVRPAPSRPPPAHSLLSSVPEVPCSRLCASGRAGVCKHLPRAPEPPQVPNAHVPAASAPHSSTRTTNPSNIRPPRTRPPDSPQPPPHHPTHITGDHGNPSLFSHLLSNYSAMPVTSRPPARPTPPNLSIPSSPTRRTPALPFSVLYPGLGTWTPHRSNGSSASRPRPAPWPSFAYPRYPLSLVAPPRSPSPAIRPTALPRIAL